MPKSGVPPTGRPAPEEVLREYPPFAKYRVRLVRGTRPGAGPALDIREYISTETFEGFTRRGIRLVTKAELELLRDVLSEILATPHIVFKGDV